MRNFKFQPFYTLTAMLVLSMSSIFGFGQDLKRKDAYSKAWERIEILENKGLPRKALMLTDSIFIMALKDNRQDELIKTVLFKLKYNSYLEEDDYVVGIYQLNDLLTKAKSPAKEILHSITAEVYWGYYSSNNWRFSNRTALDKGDSADLRTWDLTRIASKVKQHYILSLQNEYISKARPIGEFALILENADLNTAIRPTLYDFLAHRALDFAISTDFNLPGNTNTFTLDNSVYFDTNSSFLKANDSTQDSLNTKFFAAKIFHALTQFHLNDTAIDAQFNLQLERLKFARDYSTLPNSAELYLQALKRMTENYAGQPQVAEAWYYIAENTANKGLTYQAYGDTTNRWELKKAHKIATDIIAKYPSSFGAQQCQSLIATIESKMIEVTGEQAIPLNQKSKFILQYKNHDKLYYKIIKIDSDKVVNGKYSETDKLLDKLRKADAFHSETLSLNKTEDFQAHSVEIEIPALNSGLYYLLVGTDPNFGKENNAYTYFSFWSTNLTYQLRKNSDNSELLVRNRVSGKPLSKAEVIVYKHAYNYSSKRYERTLKERLYTDKDGRVSLKMSDDNTNYNFIIKVQNDMYDSFQGYYNYRNYGVNTAHNVTNFYTDRKLYRPGQTISFKGICIKYDGNERALLKDYETEVFFYDVNGQEIGKRTVKTNKFGSFEGSFLIPSSGLTGLMSIRDSFGSTNFRVEEYKRPKFNVVFDPIKKEYQVNDSVSIAGYATAFAGNSIDGSTVSFRIVRSTQLNRVYWWQWYPSIPPKEVLQGTTQTDEQGKFEITFKAAPDRTINPKELPVFTYTVYADITDINGETRSGTSIFNVGYQSLQLGHNLSEMMNSQSDFSLEMKTTNLNGEQVPAQGKLMIQKLVVPAEVFYERLWQKPDVTTIPFNTFKSKYPHDTYGNENNQYKWDIEKQVYSGSFNTGDTSFYTLDKFKSWEPGMYRFEAISTDKNNIEVRLVYYFTVFNPTAKKIPLNSPFWTKSLNNTVEPGSNAEILIGSADKEMMVLYEIEAANKIIKKEWIKLSTEQKKLSIPITEGYRGNIIVHFSALKNNRVFNQSITVQVPYTNKELDVRFSTFRNKLLPGQEEEWTLIIKNKNGTKEQAELLATLYDASLDELYTANSFLMNIYTSYYSKYAWGSPLGIGTVSGQNWNDNWNSYVNPPSRWFASLNYFGWTSYYQNYYRNRNLTFAKSEANSRNDDFMLDREESLEKVSMESPAPVNDPDFKTGGSGPLKESEVNENGKSKQDLSAVKARANFNETAFFYPQLTTDKDGTVKIKFTIPEALTKWRFLGLAHTQDLKIGTISEEIVTQKELMIVPNTPRFLREGDEITISSKISNISESDMSGAVELGVFDVFTEESVNSKFLLVRNQQSFDVKKGMSTVVSWDIKVPENMGAVKYKIVAQAGSFSDGEENVLPILSNRMLVTESLPLPIRGEETKTFNFQKLIDSGKSKTLKNHRYTLEFSSNPAWYALQAMPYMMEYPHECSEQTFTRYYSNAIATHVLNSSPKIKQVIQDWGEHSSAAFLSNVQKNQELKAVLLEETPWVLDANNEAQSKKNLAVLLDMERMSVELDKALSKVINAQSPNGGWPWFPGMKENRFITQHIITGMGHLSHLGIKDIRTDRSIWSMLQKAVNYLDEQLVSDLKQVKKIDKEYLKNQHIGYSQIQYLYARSYFGEIGMNTDTKEALAYYQGQAKTFWLKFNIYAQGMIGLAANRYEMKALSGDIVNSLKDRAIFNEEFGMYWKEYQTGYYWYEAPIETQAIMIELFDEVANDQKMVEELKIWLLKQKQTTNWKTTKQTSEAVYALLLKGVNLLESDDLVNVTIGNVPIRYKSNPDGANPYEVKAEAGTGYFKTAWMADEVKSNMGNITVSKASKGVAWGAVYWQYFEDLDKITSAETNLKLNKGIYKVKQTESGERLVEVSGQDGLKVGDKVRVRIELHTDRNLEYVHLKDMRAAGLEPINVLSHYHYQDGLGYYQSTKDAATHFFFDYIPKGTYVFEYDLRVQHKGVFSNGIATIQCMYAPEFTSHSPGITVRVE